jgi:hypothetical protein
MELDKKPSPVAKVDQSKVDTATQPPDKRRVRIVLADNAEIPPSGQFIGVNGRSYVLRSGEEADVPVEILGVLDSAVTSVPVLDENEQIVGFRDRPRFPYRIVERDINAL